MLQAGAFVVFPFLVALIAGVFASLNGAVAAEESPASASKVRQDTTQDSESGGLLYAWKPGRKYSCNYKYETKNGDKAESIEGIVTYTPQGPARIRQNDHTEKEESDKATGTAFVVAPNGVLATCAHVVAGSKKIEAVLGDKTYVATIIASDRQSDLALLKIDAKQIPCLPLFSSETAKIGQEVRVIGYPLSSLLGETVKATRGSLCGVVKQDDVDLFQVDASINFGNSGSPMVDNQGRVLGVASSFLGGKNLQNVNFFVPSATLKNMMQKRSIAIEEQKDGPDLPGPDLVAKVTPAVALIRTTLAPERHKPQQILLSYEKKSPNAIGGLSSFLTVDAFGNVDASAGETGLPIILGGFDRLAVEAMPEDGRGTWTKHRPVTLDHRVTIMPKPDPRDHLRPPPPERPGIRPGPGYSPRPYSYDPPSMRRPSPLNPSSRTPSLLAPQTVHVVAVLVETMRYRIKKEDEATITIERDYEVTTLPTTQKLQQTIASGKGTLIWDKKTGFPKQMELRGEVKSPDPNDKLEHTFSLSYEAEVGDAPPPTPPATKAPSTPASRPAAPAASTPVPIAPAPRATPKPPPSALEQAPKTSGLDLFDPN